MADPPNGNGKGAGSGRKETATWAIGAATASLITGWAGAVQVIQEPLERDISAINRRLDEAILASSQARNALRAQIVEASKDVLTRSEERMDAAVERQAQTNVNLGHTVSEVAARVNRIELDRSRLIESAVARIQRIEDHVNAIDSRVLEIEKTFTRVLRDDRRRSDMEGSP